jgi:Mu transposase, C-terminal domain
MKGKEKNMTEVRNIIHRLRMGHSKRQIERELKVHRSIIRELYRIAMSREWLNSELPMPSDEEIAQFRQDKINRQAHPLDIYKNQIADWIKEGCSSVVIQQLLLDKYPCDIQVIRRYRKKHFPDIPEPIMVRTTLPGQEMEVDFGELGKFLDDFGVTKKVWVLSCRLRHSRRAYREIVKDQTLQTFLMGHIHAFEYFNGVPKICVVDNTKTAVIKSTIDNELMNRSYQDLAEHYRFVIHPCPPYTPEQKGGVEGDVKYTKRNFLPYFLAKQKEQGIVTPKISDLAAALAKWNDEIADIHLVHGVGRSPLEIFKSEEMNTLQSLPKKRFELTSWHRCEVKRDWRIMVLSTYYSVPYRLIGETVEVCMTDSLVRIFHKHQVIAVHKRAEKKWEYQRKSEHAPPFHEAVLQCTREGLLLLAQEIGPWTHDLVQKILSHPTVDKLKPIRYLLKLSEKFSKERLEKACQRACSYKTYSYMSVKNILTEKLDAIPIEEIQAKKIIPLPRPRFTRDVDDYKTDFSKVTLEDKLERTSSFSRHGNGMARTVFEMVHNDAIIEEHLKEQKENNFNGLAEQ